jgi:hypothetical protein
LEKRGEGGLSRALSGEEAGKTFEGLERGREGGDAEEARERAIPRWTC